MPRTANKSDSEDIFETIFEQKNIDRLTDKLSASISGIVEKQLISNSVINQLTKALESSLIEMIEKTVDAKLKTVNEELISLKKDVTDTKKKSSLLEQQLSKTQEYNESLRDQIEAMERYSRRDNLVITGLPSHSYSGAATTISSNDTADGSDWQAAQTNIETEHNFITLCEAQLGVKLNSSDISVAHKLITKPSGNINSTTGSQSSTAGSPRTMNSTIIVRFTNRRARDAVYSARSKLKGSHIYINEHLTTNTATLFKSARLLVKRKLLQSAFTRNGLLFTKVSGLLTERPKLVRKASDLPHG
jgi:hypothetical protein